MKIIEGKQTGAMKTVIYGPEGIGKSTLANQFPRPLFIDTEGSTKHLDTRRTERPTSWAMLMDQVKNVKADPGVCATLVIDTADWAEQLCIAEICAAKKLTGIEDMGYGKGYIYLAEEFGRLLNLLEDVIARGVNVVLTAHAQMRKFEQPDEMGAYDRWELKLQKKTAALVKEWADLLLFANYKTMVVATDKDNKKHKAQGGRRVMYTAHHPCWDAKNRLGLPDELPLEFAPLAPHIPILTGTGGNGAETQGEAPAPAPAPAPTPAPAPAPATPPTAPAPAAAHTEATPSAPSAPKDQPKASAPAESPKPAGGPPPEYQDQMNVPAKLAPLLASAKVSEREVREVIAQRQGVFPMGTTWEVMDKAGFVDGWVLKFWDQIVETIRSNPDRLPF